MNWSELEIENLPPQLDPKLLELIDRMRSGESVVLVNAQRSSPAVQEFIEAASLRRRAVIVERAYDPPGIRLRMAGDESPIDPGVALFLSGCVRDANAMERSSALRAAYLESCQSSEIEPVSVTAFGLALSRAGVKPKRSGGYVYRLGLRLKPTPNEA